MVSKHTIRNLLNFICVISAAILFSAGSASTAEKPRQGESILRDTYQRNVSKLDKNSFGIPLFLDSYERDDKVHVDVYGVFTHPFGGVANALKVPANWCDIVSLYPNVKACTYSNTPDDRLLNFYLGSKDYQPPEDARKLIFQFRIIDQQQGYLDILLNANEGPFGTRDHKIRVEALRIDSERTFVHVSYSYSDSSALRFASKIYFATLGRSKVGFTVTGTDSGGRPLLIGGPRGAVERNAIRCYFAIQSVMNTLSYPEDSRFARRISEWYDLTTRYRLQLFDLEKKDYQSFKATEHKNQETLQRQVVPGGSE